MVVSYTIIWAAPSNFEGHVPYCIALIKLAEGPVISAGVVDFTGGELINKKVRAVFRKQGERKNGVIHYGFKFELAE